VDDTPFVNDGADTSLRKAVSLLNKIEAKTGSATITGPVTVTNEVEIKNDANNPLPVSDNNGSLTVDGTVELGSTSLAALENISVTFPATQNVNVTNAGLNVSASTLPLPAGASTETTLASVDTRLSNIDSDLGSTSESAASTDTSISGINGLLKRLLQRITTLIYPPFASGSFTNSGGASTGIDCGGYNYLVQHISGGGGGYNRPIQWSYDNVNWTQGGVVFRHISGAGSSSTGNEAHWTVMGDILGTSSGIFVIPVVGRYFRLGASTGGGGSWTHNWYLHKGPFPGIVEEGIGARNSNAATTDTSDVGLNGLFKRLLQRLTTLLPANLTVSSTRLLVDGSGVTQPVSLASAPVTPVTDNGGSLTVDGTVTVNDMTSGNAKTKIVDSVGADVSYITAGTAGTPSAGVLSVQGINGGVSLPISGTVTANGGDFSGISGTTAPAKVIPIGFIDTIDTGNLIQVGTDGGEGLPTRIKETYIDGVGYRNLPIWMDGNGSPDVPISGTVTDVNIGQTSDSAATTDTGTFSVIALIKRGLQNRTSLLAKIPALVSGRIPVDGSGVTQPTRETQPTGDYVINSGALSFVSPSGTSTSTSTFDAGANADYVVLSANFSGTNGAFLIDVSTDGSSWQSGLYNSIYYDAPALSSTDTYSYRAATGSLYGGTQSSYSGRYIINCVQNVYFQNFAASYRYFRITTPAAYGTMRYRFTSYKSNKNSISQAGAGSITTVNGRVDIGFMPTVVASVSQATATNLKTQAESYQGGTAVGSANPLQVTLANTGANATAVKVDGSAVTQPVSGTVTINNSQGATVTQSTFTSTTASTSLVAASANRKILTVFNEGAGMLYVSAGSACTTTAYQVRLSAGDYWECPSNQTSLAHTAVFATSGNARVTEVV